MRLFEPIPIGGMTVPNRIVMPAMTTRLAGPRGEVTPELTAYYLARARGGAGLITVEMTSPEPEGRHRAGELSLIDPGNLSGLQALNAALHATGARTAVQIGHAGGHTREDVTGWPPVAPSAIAHQVQEGDTRTVIPWEMTPERIARCVEAFASAAALAREAGFDAVELHAAHGYLLAQFLSPLDNRRGDRYGGSLGNRARFALEVVEACRGQVGAFPILFRISADEFAPGGLTPEEAVRVCQWVVEAGADAVHVSAGCYRSLPSGAVMIPPMNYPQGVFLPLARAVRERVRVPVICVGRMHDPALAEKALAGGSADLVALGRALVADPEWPNKVREGRPEAIRPCISCNTCVDKMREGDRLHCLANPLAGRESAFEERPAEIPKTVLVIGGGPAGMEAARILARRGHRVQLQEARAALGGQLALARLAPRFQNVQADGAVIQTLIDFLARELERAGVTVKLGHSATLAEIRTAAPDVVVLATGATYRFPLGYALPWLLRSGLARRGWLGTLLAHDGLRRLFYALRKRERRLAEGLCVVGLEVREIGDCIALGKVREALLSAAELAYRL